MVEEDKLEADAIFIEPPDCRTISDEDSDSEEKNDINKLSGSQLRSGAELRTNEAIEDELDEQMTTENFRSQATSVTQNWIKCDNKKSHCNLSNIKL